MAGLPRDALKQLRDGAMTGDLKRDALVRFVKAPTNTAGTMRTGFWPTR